MHLSLMAGWGSGFPRAFLSVGARADRWRGLLNAIDAAAFVRPPAWLDEVVSGVKKAFRLFASSALEEANLLKHAGVRDLHALPFLSTVG